MRFALIENNRTEAQPKLSGLCCCCSMPVVAKCGNRKIWHWAHKSKKDCDNWWEPETEWHRNWKEEYLIEWQEKSFYDKITNEKHIADVFTSNKLVIEFQHSNIHSQERTSREQFYKNMVWVVDGTRLKRDFPRFLKEWKSCDVYETEKKRIFKVMFPEYCFPEVWLKSSVPVVFDFLGDGTLVDSEGLRNNLYCLFPQNDQHTYVAVFSRKAFIETTINGEWSVRIQEFIKDIRKQVEIEQREHRSRNILSSNTIRYTFRGIPLIGGKKEFIKRSRRM
jgi:hypothetical protein